MSSDIDTVSAYGPSDPSRPFLRRGGTRLSFMRRRSKNTNLPRMLNQSSCDTRSSFSAKPWSRCYRLRAATVGAAWRERCV